MQPPDPRPAMDARVAIHAALTCGMAWLAIILALPGDTFGQAHGWDCIAQIGTETTWAMVFWAVACFGAVGLFTPGRLARLVTVLMLSMTYGCIAALMLWASPAGSGSGTYAIMAGLGYYLAWRRTHEAV